MTTLKTTPKAKASKRVTCTAKGCTKRFVTSDKRTKHCSTCTKQTNRAAKAANKQCSRCARQTPAVTFRTSLCSICDSCQIQDNSLLRALKRTIDKYKTTYCFPTLADLIAWCELRREAVMIGQTYAKIGSYSIFVPASLDICHHNPSSNGGLMTRSNLFLWHSTENQRVKNSNAHLWVKTCLPETLNDNNSLSDIHLELLSRFGDEYLELWKTKSLIPATKKKQSWQLHTGCSDKENALRWLHLNNYSTTLTDENLTAGLLARVSNLQPVAFHKAYSLAMMDHTALIKLPVLTKILHSIVPIV
jgi:hypothetical protein